MTPLVACVVCAQPLDSLLTSGLQAGVLVMALLALGMVAALLRGAVAVIRADAREHAGETAPGGPR